MPDNSASITFGTSPFSMEKSEENFVSYREAALALLECNWSYTPEDHVFWAKIYDRLLEMAKYCEKPEIPFKLGDRVKRTEFKSAFGTVVRIYTEEKGIGILFDSETFLQVVRRSLLSPLEEKC